MGLQVEFFSLWFLSLFSRGSRDSFNIDDVPGIVVHLALIYTSKVTVSSNMAREWATELALLASLGFITTIEGARYGKVWRITSKGLTYVLSN